MKKIITCFILVILLVACGKKDNKESKNGLPKENTTELPESVKTFIINACSFADDSANISYYMEEAKVIIDCNDGKYVYTLIPEQDTYLTTYRYSIATQEFTYLKYGKSLGARLSGSIEVLGKEMSDLFIFLHLEAGENYEKVFDVVYDIAAEKYFAYDVVSKQKGEEVVFLDSLKDQIKIARSMPLRYMSRMIRENYGNVYQITSVLLGNPATKLREDAYDLPLSPMLSIHLQYDLTKEGTLYRETGNYGTYFNWDFQKKLVVFNTCEEGCDYRETVFDLTSDVITFYPTTKKIVIDPDTCTTDDFCLPAKFMKMQFIKDIAFQTSLIPFKDTVALNEDETTGNMIEINRYYEKIKAGFHE